MASNESGHRGRRGTGRPEYGLFTPEPTPGPEQARIDADKSRQTQEGARLSTITEHVPGENALSAQTKSEADIESAGSTQATVDGDDDDDEEVEGEEERPGATPEQLEAVERVLACRVRDHRKILDLGPRQSDERAERETVVNSFRKQGCLLHPDHNSAPRAGQALDRLIKAGQKLGVDRDEINEIKYWDGVGLEELRLSDGGRWVSASDDMDVVDESTVVRLSLEHQEVWKAATPILGQLMHQPGDVQVKNKLEALNEEIVAQNRRQGCPPEEERIFTIDVQTFSAIFSTAAPYLARLGKSHGDEEALRQFHVLNEQLATFNQQHQYPKEWVMVIPAEEAQGHPLAPSISSTTPGVSGKPAYRRVVRKVGYVQDNGVEKKIEGIMKVGFGHQLVISHAGRDNLTKHEIVPVSRFGKGFGQSYLESAGATTITLGAAADLQSKDLVGMAVAGVASVERSVKSQPMNGWCTEAKTIVLVGFGEEPDQFTWYARSVLGRRFGRQVVDDEINEYRSAAGQEQPLGPTRRRTHGSGGKAPITFGAGPADPQSRPQVGAVHSVDHSDEVSVLLEKVKTLEKELTRTKG